MNGWLRSPLGPVARCSWLRIVAIVGVAQWREWQRRLVRETRSMPAEGPMPLEAASAASNVNLRRPTLQRE
jgi:hypothetical protein